MKPLRDRLIQCFSLVFPDLPEAEIPLASTVSWSKWDSLANLSLITILEEEFEVSVADDDVETLVSFDVVYEYVKSKVDVEAIGGR